LCIKWQRLPGSNCKVNFSSSTIISNQDDIADSSHFGFIVLKHIKLFGFLIFQFWAYLMKVILSVPDEGYSERTWWRLFWAYVMKVILSVPDEGYSERTWWRLFWAYLMKVILSVPDEGYFERTWWRLFHKCVMLTKFDIYIFFSCN
jgi:hypothetical protein